MDSHKTAGYSVGLTVGDVFVNTKQFGKVRLEEAIERGWVGQYESLYEKKIRSKIQNTKRSTK